MVLEEPDEPRKRKRLSHACNLCRSRKVRCDEQMPACGNCQRAGAVCITTNPRKPKEAILSRRKSTVDQTTVASDSDENAVAQQLLAMEHSAQNSMAAAAAQSLSPLSATRSSVHIVSPHSQILGTIEQDPAANDGDVAYNVNAGDDKRKYLGASNLQVLIQWLDFSFSAFGVERNLSSFFQFGMSASEEITHPLILSLPPLPPETEYTAYVDIFFSRIHPLFPLLDERKFRQSIPRFTNANLNTLPSSELAMLSCIYSVISLGADELAGHNTDVGSRFFSGAFHLYAHLVAYPYRTSVQAILLLVLTLRGLNKDGASCNLNGQAVRLAMSIGLHRKSSSKNASDDPELDARVWWVTFSLEKILGFESGRPSAIHDSECGQIIPASLSLPGETDFFGAVIGLAKVRSAISSQLFMHRPVPRSIEEHLRCTGELDQALQDWAETVPKDVRPGCDIFCPPHLRPFAGFLSLQFHETMAMLHRAGLLLDSTLLKRQLELHCPNSPWNHRLLASEAICVSSARSMIKILSDLLSVLGHTPRVINLTSSLFATFVLAIHILKHPSAWLAQSDLGLLTTAAKYVEEKYSELGFSADFHGMLTILRELATNHVNQARAQSTQTPGNPPLPVFPGVMEGETNTNATFNNLDMTGHTSNTIFDEEALWNGVFGESLSQLIDFNNEINLEESLSLFGLPWLANKEGEGTGDEQVGFFNVQ